MATGNSFAPLIPGAPAQQRPGQGGVLAIPVPPATARKNADDSANTGSQIGSRDVQNVNTNANTDKTVVQTEQERLQLQQAQEARAKADGLRREAIGQVDAGLQAIRDAYGRIGTFSTGSIGELIGGGDLNPQTGRREGGLAGLPLIGGAIYGGSDRSALDTSLGTINSAQRFNFIQYLKEQGATMGNASTGTGATNAPEFTSLGQTQFNLRDAQSAGPDALRGELDKATQSFLRRKAALSVPASDLVNASPEERQKMLDAAYTKARDEFYGAPGGGNGGGGQGGGSNNLEIAKGGMTAVPDPSKKGLNSTVAGMIRGGASADDILSVMRDRGVVIEPNLIALVQANVQGYRPYVGKQLPANFPDPRVNVEVRYEDVGLGSRIAGAVTDSPFGAYAVNAANALTMGGLDELAGMTGGEDAARKAELVKGYLNENYPVSSTLGTITGATASVLPVARAGGLALKAAPRLGALAATTAQGAFTGALENNNDRTGGAIMGAALNVGGEGVGRLAAPVLRMGGEAFSKYAPNLLDVAPKPSAAESVLASQIDDPNAVRGVLAQAEKTGSPVALADTSPALRNLAGSTVRNSTEAGALAERNIRGRNIDQSNRAVQVISDTLASETNVKRLGTTIREQGQQAADPLYKNAYKQMAPVADTEINSLLQTDAVKSAIPYAKKIASNERVNWKSLGVDLDQEGNVVLKEGASWRSLDIVKRGIDTYLDEFRDKTTDKLATNDLTRSVLKARDDLVVRMRDLNPEYGQALDTYQPFAANAKALEMGGSAIGSTKANPKQIAEVVAGMSDAERANYQIGAANALIDRVNKLRDKGDVFDLFRSPDMRDRLGAIFPDKADALANIQTKTDLEGLMSQTKTELLGGSQTAGRLQADEAFGAQANTRAGVLNNTVEAGAAVATGGVSLLPKLVQMGVLGFKNANKLQAVKNQDALGRDLAPILLETNPKKAQQLMDGVLSKVDRYGNYKAKTNKTGALVGAVGSRGVLMDGQD